MTEWPIDEGKGDGGKQKVAHGRKQNGDVE